MHAGLMLWLSAVLSADEPSPPPSVPAPAPYEAPPPQEPRAATDARPKIAITVESPRHNAELFEVFTQDLATMTPYGERRYSVSQTYRICHEPCKGVLSGSNGDFVVRGDGIVDSDPFTLAGAGRAVTLHVDPGSTVVHGFGKFGVIFGSFVAGVGTLGTLFGALGGAQDHNPGVFAGLVSTAAAGLAVLVTGVLLMVMSRTTVAIEPFAEAPPPQSVPPSTM